MTDQLNELKDKSVTLVMGVEQLWVVEMALSVALEQFGHLDGEIGPLLRAAILGLHEAGLPLSTQRTLAEDVVLGLVPPSEPLRLSAN